VITRLLKEFHLGVWFTAREVCAFLGDDQGEADCEAEELRAALEGASQKPIRMVNSKVVGERLKSITDNPVMIEGEPFRLARLVEHQSTKYRVERIG
jgi:hypothetical protein